ncbi:L-lactate dehydrogenase [Sphingobium jiangsuense]|uniref:L-lactate dehydrogenase (Cytochrome) n=1 Tax=Sphingobium jiangsuense TaxID=870476 RepID=A0A7W6BJX5_9SPHN|nr:L-lactate dehydrogenase [Sphingobium jiangsuense]MBB3928415.1 L-lactate dehydrogenase (cytochrome) [Sphingobium jiangsuense]GLS99794.1 L-lactate dehydrogenase [Sphingobium jiangsuense]
MTPRSLADYKHLAERRLPRFLFEYVEAGSYLEQTRLANRRDLAGIGLRQRVLRDVSRIDMSATVLGHHLPFPVALAPVGMAGMMARRGEVQAARAAREIGVPFTLSSASCCRVEEVGAASGGGPFWFQLYMLKDRGYMASLLTRAREAGCTALLVTVDLPCLGARYRDYRSGISNDPWPVRIARMAGQVLPRPHWLWNVGLRGRPHTLGNIADGVERGASLARVMGFMQANLENAAGWNIIDWLRRHWDGPIVVKGVLDAEDAREAVRGGADGIVVSNHGGRQLDGVPSTARALPAIADAVGGELTVLVDGGVRTGLDVARMLALGAEGVLIGRAWAYPLAAQGQRGVAHMLGLLRDELRVAMALTGATRIAELTRTSLLQS